MSNNKFALSNALAFCTWGLAVLAVICFALAGGALGYLQYMERSSATVHTVLWQSHSLADLRAVAVFMIIMTIALIASVVALVQGRTLVELRHAHQKK